MAEVSEAAGSPKKRGRPKGPTKKTLLKAATASDTPKRARGRPRTKPEVVNGTPGKRGRPKGSTNKKPKPIGRPRIHPLSPANEKKKPKVWKPLGRPRKDGKVPRAADVPRTPTGRPAKGGLKRAKKDTYDGPPRKRGRPKSAGAGEVEASESPRKRGRPKSAVAGAGEVEASKSPRKRGRPPKSAVAEEPESAGEVEASE